MLREGIPVLWQAPMKAEVAASIGAERHERTGERTAYRYGSRTRTWDARRHHRAGDSQGHTRQLLSLVAAAAAARRARATRRGAGGVRARRLHAQGRRADEGARARRRVEVGGLPHLRGARSGRRGLPHRPLIGEHPYVWVDATYHKVRVDGHVTSQATVVAVGVTAESERQVLGIDVGPSEDRAFRTAFLRSLVKQGLKRGTSCDLRRTCRAEAGDQHRGE